MQHKVLLNSLTLGLAVLLATAICVTAQTTSGSLSGTVNDAQGAAIAGAKVQVTSTSRNETRTTQTGEDGRFVFPQLQPDTYTLRVEANGFKSYELEGVVLNANDKISAPDIQLAGRRCHGKCDSHLQWRAAANRER